MLLCLNISGLLLLLLSRTVAEKHPIIYSLRFSHRLLNYLLFSFLWEMPWYIANSSSILQGYGNSLDELQKDFLETYGLWDCQRQSLLEPKHSVFWMLTTANGTYCYGDCMISDGITTPPSTRVELLLLWCDWELVVWDCLSNVRHESRSCT